MKTIQRWSWTHSRDGFAVELNESSYFGSVLSDILQSFEADWWGKYKNMPFCWINPWGWTWKIGTEDHNLGSLWMTLGQRYLNFCYRLEKDKTVKRIYFTDDEVKSSFSEIWEWAHYWDEDDE